MIKRVALIMAAILILLSASMLYSCENKSITVGGGGGSSSSKKPQTEDTPEGEITSEKTKITLPSKTESKTYLATAGTDYIDVSADSEIKSNAIVLVDITDNKVIAGTNIDTKIYPASMTKVMTLLVACENAKDPTKKLTVTSDMVEKYSKTAGASVAFTWHEGYQVTVEDALYLVIYESDTYACWLLADYVAGSEAKFVEKMNEKASELGLTSTNFVNSTGLFNANHYTTCREMAAIMAAAMNNSAASAVLTRKEKYTVDIYQEDKKLEEVGMWSGWYTGRLEEYRLSGVAPKYVGGGSDVMITAGKTGYEDIPKNCFVTAAENDTTGRKYVCVQVGRTDSSQDTVNTKTSTDDTRNIYRKYAKDE